MANKQAISYERHYYLCRIWWATFCLFTEVSRNFSNKRDCYYPANEVFGERHFDYSLKSAEISQSSAIVITARKRSCGKVMFLHLSVILFTGGGVSVWGVSIQGSLWLQGGVSDCRGSLLGRYLPYSKERAVRILLECILVWLMSAISWQKIYFRRWGQITTKALTVVSMVYLNLTGLTNSIRKFKTNFQVPVQVTVVYSYKRQLWLESRRYFF